MRLLLALVVILSASQWMPSGAQQIPTEPVQLEKLPVSVLNAKLPALEGSDFSLSEYFGKVLVINLWASWVGPSRLEAPELEKLYKQYASQGVVVIGLSIEDPDKSGSVVREWVHLHNLHYRIGWSTPEVSNELMQGKELVPQTFVVSRSGRIVRRFVGFSLSKTSPLFKEAIEEALKEDEK